MDDLIKQGATAFKAGDIETARKLLTEAIKLHPDDERAWGWMYNICNTDQERILCLKQMVRINPQNEKANLLLTELLNLEPPLEMPVTNQNVSGKFKKNIWWPWGVIGIVVLLCIGAVFLGSVLLLQQRAQPSPTEQLAPTATTIPLPKALFDSNTKVIPVLNGSAFSYGTFVLTDVTIQQDPNQLSEKDLVTVFFEIKTNNGENQYSRVEFAAIGPDGVILDSVPGSSGCNLGYKVKVQDGGTLKTCLSFSIPSNVNFDVYYAPFANDRFNENKSIKWHITRK
ncbi:MAG: tetratricopeptide repeat protein [Chloroflexi bacterium]|nr:tetratricopeptide repeat protein [Chloroflexota bacterium]